MTSAGPVRFSFDRGVPESATLGARIGAFAIDLLLLFLVNLVLAAALVGVGVVEAPDPSRPAEEAAEEPFVLLLFLLEAPVGLAYFLLAEARWGRTVGKLALGLSVLSVSGEPVRLWQSALRNLLRFLWFVPLASLAFVVIDWYLMRTTEMDQRIGDLAARTIVVKDGAWWPPEAAVGA